MLLSDIVVCRLWVPVEPPAACVAVRNLLEPFADASSGRGLARTVADLRRATRTPIPVAKDSLYKGPVVRAPRTFSKHLIPKKLVARLPFASKPKDETAPRSTKRPGYLKQRDDARTGLAPREAPEDRASKKLVHQLEAVRNEKKRIRDASVAAKKAVRRRDLAKVDASRARASKLKAKAEHKRAGKDEARKRAKFSAGD